MAYRVRDGFLHDAEEVEDLVGWEALEIVAAVEAPSKLHAVAAKHRLEA